MSLHSQPVYDSVPTDFNQKPPDGTTPFLEVRSALIFPAWVAGNEDTGLMFALSEAGGCWVSQAHAHLCAFPARSRSHLHIPSAHLPALPPGLDDHHLLLVPAGELAPE